MLWPVLCLLLLDAGAEWTRFRGPNGSGVSSAASSPTRLDPKVNLAWVATVPPGRSSPIVKDGRVFLSATEGDRLVVLAYDLSSGKQLWKHSLLRSRRNEIDGPRNDPASPSPAADARGIYVFFHDFGLISFTRDGKERWRLPLGPFVNNYGMGTSPVVYGGLVVLQCDQVQGSYLLAADTATGVVRWRKDRASAIEGWSTPLLWQERSELIVLGSGGLEAFDLKTGKSSWTVPTGGGLMIPVPSIDKGHVFATFRGSEHPTFPSWESVSAKLDRDGDHQLTPDEIETMYARANFGIADPNRDGFITEAEWNMFRNRGVGDFGITAVRLSDRTISWQYKRGIPYVPSPLVYRDVLYAVRTGGIVLALNASDGTVHKEARLPGAGGDYLASPVASDGKVFFASADGVISVIRADPNWDVIASTDLGEPIFASPAIVEDGIVLRTASKLYLFRDRKQVRSE